jgi:hypothetical protein
MKYGITSSGDIWDVPSLNKEVEEEVEVENKEEEGDKDSNISTSGLGYIIYVGTHDLRLISRNVVIVVLLGCMMIHCMKQTTWSIY